MKAASMLERGAMGVAAVSLLTLTACSGGSNSSAVSGGPATASTSASTARQAQTALSASQAAKAMGIGSFTAYTAESDPNHLLGRQREYTSKVNWSKGSIEVFGDVADAKAREAYLKAFTCPLGDGYDYLDGSALLRLNCALTPSQAKTKEAAFKKVEASA